MKGTCFGFGNGVRHQRGNALKAWWADGHAGLVDEIESEA